MSVAALPRMRSRALAAPGLTLAVLGWAALVAAGHLLGTALVADDPLVLIGAPPVVGAFDVRLSARLLPALALAAAAITWAPVLARRLPWRALVGVCAAAALAWPVALAATDGLGALPAPLETRYEYLADVPRVGDPGAFLSTFTEDVGDYRTHVKGHPPGLLLALSQLDRVGLGGGVVAAVLVLVGGALTAPAALVALRELGGETRARASAPFLALAPAAVWMATSADALFAGVAAVGIALFALAAGRPGPRGIALGTAAGIVLGAGLLLSYGIAPLGGLVLLIAAYRRALVPLVAAAAGVAAVAGAFALAGFWWLDGLHATRELYDSGVSQRRPHAQFAVIGLAAFALALGPAVPAALARLRDRGTWVLVAGGLVAVATAAASGLSRGETERIWLPFAPWLLVATATLERPRRWLAAQLALGLALQVGVRTPW